MTAGHVFVDTNILVYAHDAQAGERHRAARERLREALQRPLLPAISAQVIHELYVTLLKHGVSAKSAREVIGPYLDWEVVANDASLAREGMQGADRWRISLWDALIIAAAKRAKADVIWSEDLNAGQDYGGVVVVNPLLP